MPGLDQLDGLNHLWLEPCPGRNRIYPLRISFMSSPPPQPSYVLDASFGINGTVSTDVGRSDTAQDAVLQPDGKLLVLGIKDPAAVGAPFGSKLTLIRYNSDGSLDRGFLDQVGELLLSNDFKVALQADGKILVVGVSDNRQSFRLIRLNPDGTIDPGFGNGGQIEGYLGTTAAQTNRIADVVVQADGKIVLVGTVLLEATGPNANQSDLALVRYDVEGKLDDSFGQVGKVLTNLGNYELATCALIQADGKIVVGGSAGSSLRPGFSSEFAVLRYNLNGSLDTKFGNHGRAITGFTTMTEQGPSLRGDRVIKLTLQPDGKIVAAGTTSILADSGFDANVGSDFALARYNPDGTLDQRFGTGGRVIAGGQPGNLIDLALRPDGNLLVVGSRELQTGHTLVRFNSDGIAELFPVAVDMPQVSNLFFKDGAVFVVGAEGTIDNRDFALMRFVPSKPIDQSGLELPPEPDSSWSAVTRPMALPPAAINFGQGKLGVRRAGTQGANRIMGTKFRDLLVGSAGDDLIRGQAGTDRLSGDSGKDGLRGGKDADQIQGGSGDDHLWGEAGDDLLIGNSGEDILTGGTGRDLFVFQDATDGEDQITDFDPAADLIDLRPILAGRVGVGSSFPVPVSTNLTPQTDQAAAERSWRFTQFVELTATGSQTLVRVDADGNGAFAALVRLNVPMTALSGRNFLV